MIACTALANTLQQYCNYSHFLHAYWYQQLGYSAKNPSILGFIVKHMLLSAICDFGCPLASEGLESGDWFVGSALISWFSRDYPVLWPPPYGKSPRTQLFIPGSHRCKFIDGVFVH